MHKNRVEVARVKRTTSDTTTRFPPPLPPRKQGQRPLGDKNAHPPRPVSRPTERQHSIPHLGEDDAVEASIEQGSRY